MMIGSAEAGHPDRQDLIRDRSVALMIPSARVLPFELPSTGDGGSVGRVHRDGSITFRGETYETIKQVPPECRALLPDQETFREWKRIYRAIAPPAPLRRPAPGWSVIE